MILQTTSGFSKSGFSEELFPLGPWCAPGDSPETSITSDFGEDYKKGNDAESDQVIRKIEQFLYSSLNELHHIQQPISFWRESLGIYLRMMVPLLLQRRDLVLHARDFHGHSRFTQVEIDLESIIPINRQALLGIVNSHAWNHYVFSELSAALGLAPISPSPIQVLRGPNQVEPRHALKHRHSLLKRTVLRMSNALATRSSTLVVRTMLPKRHETWLALRNFSLPFSWNDDEIERQPINYELRSKLVSKALSQDAIEKVILRLSVQFIPRVFIEDFSAAWQLGENRVRQFPRVVFTSNLHLASDVFLIWLARAHFFGTRIVIAQHGGVHSLCRHIPGDLQAERDLADTYITWGAPTFRSMAAIPGPTLVNVGAKKRRKSVVDNGSLLVVLDSTYRYPSVPRGMNGSRFDYASFVNQFLESIDLERVPHVVIRSYMGAEIYDDPLIPLLLKRESFSIDSGEGPIQKLFDSSRLVVQTSLGTTFFQTFHQQIPTNILLDRELSPISDSAAEAFFDLREAGVYLDNPNELARHVNDVFHDPHQWWSSPGVQASIKRFESKMSPVFSRPSRFYNQVLRGSTRDL